MIAHLDPLCFKILVLIERVEVYCTKGIDKSPVLQPFTEIHPQIDQMNSLRMQTLAEAAREQAGDRPSPKRYDISCFNRCPITTANPGTRSVYMNTTVKADIETLQAALEVYTAAIEPLKAREGIVLSMTLQPYPLSLLQRSVTQGGNVLGLEPELGPLVRILFLTFWERREDDEKIVDTLREALDQVEREAETRGTLVPFKYLNYATTFQEPIGSYGGGNIEKLHHASQKFDPEGLFQKGVPGGWKLFS